MICFLRLSYSDSLLSNYQPIINIIRPDNLRSFMQIPDTMSDPVVRGIISTGRKYVKQVTEDGIVFRI